MVTRAQLDSMDPQPRQDGLEVDAAWRAEVARRVEDIEQGTVELEDGPTVMARLRSQAQARLDRRRP